MSLKYRKIDLHVHSPFSHDFVDKRISLENFIDAAQKKGLDAIAITDHNTVDAIDDAKRIGKEKGFTIFPGFEVSCVGGEKGPLHILAVYDPSKTQKDLLMVLGKLDIKGEGETACTAKSAYDVINIIRSTNGLPILAHANSSHGALNDIRGNPRITIVQNKNLIAVQATTADFDKSKGSRLIDILNGNDPQYKRKLAVFKASDNKDKAGTGHGIDSIGETFTFFKMGELSLESLRQCFEDPDIRIFQDFEEEKIKDIHPKILEIEVNNGFLSGLHIKFHSGMNSVIGGTGVGKSLLIEFIRFVFNKPPNQSLLADHKSKLEKRLGLSSEVEVKFQDNSGDIYSLKRKLINIKDPYSSMYECVNVTTGEQYGGNLDSIFPLLIYSQGEIAEISKDSKAQLKLLENFRDFQRFADQSEGIKSKLSQNDFALYTAIKDASNIDTYKREYSTLDEQIKKIERLLRGKLDQEVFDKHKKLSTERTEALQELDKFDQVIGEIDQMIAFAQSKPHSEEDKLSLKSKIRSSVEDSYNTIIGNLQTVREQILKKKEEALIEIKKWEDENNYVQIQKLYDGELNKQKKEKEVEQQRQILVKSFQDVQKKYQQAEEAQKQKEKLLTERGELLNQLQVVRGEHYTARKEQAELITRRAKEKLKVDVLSASDKEKYRSNLSQLKIGSYANEKDIDAIVETFSPIELVNIAFSNDYQLLAQKTEISEEKSQRIIAELFKEQNILSSLKLQYESYPEDNMEILYKKKDNSYYPLSELSMGQKADALMMIALGDSTMPVIIDQPEDALDISSIWADVCTRLRVSKHARQFVFTTHNSSIAVSSDSDQFILMEADASKGWVQKVGSIDQDDIKHELIGYLEGGVDSYSLKRTKYGL